MSLTLAGIIVALPFASAALLACIGSWRAGVRINIASTSLLFVLACLLPLHFASALAAHLAVLTSFVAMTTSWFGWRDVRAALATRRLDRYRTRLHHVAVQVLVGAMLLAILSDTPALTWLGTAIAVAAAAGLTGTVHTMAAQRATGRLLKLCGVALMLALFGTLLLYLAAATDVGPLQWSTGRFHLASPDLAVLCLVLGYGGIAGLFPLYSWLPDIASEGTAPGATLINALLANVPLLAILRVRCTIADGPDASVALLVVLGLATLLVAGFCLMARMDTRRSLAFAGTAQTGIVVFAFGLGGRTATLAGLLLMTLITLAKAAALQCSGPASITAAARTRTVSVLALAALPIYALSLVAGTTADYAAWLLLPLGAGVLLTAGSLVGGLLPVPVSAQGPNSPASLLELAPVWLQLVAVLLLAVAMPGPVVGWFRGMVEFG